MPTNAKFAPQLQLIDRCARLSEKGHCIFVLGGFIVDRFLLRGRTLSDVHYVRGGFVRHSVADAPL